MQVMYWHYYVNICYLLNGLSSITRAVIFLWTIACVFGESKILDVFNGNSLLREVLRV